MTVTAPWEIGEQPQADAMATNVPGIALGILTADCAPVLLADDDARVIGAAHAGWKGALGGVIANVVEAMEELGACRTRIAAAIGPAIAQANYEVGPEFRDAFHGDGFRRCALLRAGRRPDHWQFDLEGFVARPACRGRVRRCGTPGHLHLCGRGRFFSFRRTTHRGEPDYGRDISAIVLRP